MKRVFFPLIPVLLLAALGWWLVCRPTPQRNAWHVRELATQGLAEYLARTRPGSRVLVISNPFTRQKGIAPEIVAMEQAGLRGLNRGLGSALTIEATVFPELKPEALTDPQSLVTDPETSTPLSYLVTEETFDKLARRHSDCALIVSLIGLPANLEQVKCWQSSAGPQFALLLPDLRWIGNAAAVAGAVKRGKLAAFVLDKPGAPGGESGPRGNFATEFEKRFLLVTAQNIDDVIEKYPQLFPAGNP